MHKWRRVRVDDACIFVLKVFNGWLVKAPAYQSVTFMPDPNHEQQWDYWD